MLNKFVEMVLANPSQSMVLLVHRMMDHWEAEQNKQVVTIDVTAEEVVEEVKAAPVKEKKQSKPAKAKCELPRKLRVNFSERVYHYVHECMIGDCTAAEVSAETGCNPTTAWTELTKLVRAGKMSVTKVPSDRGRAVSLYRLVPTAEAVAKEKAKLRIVTSAAPVANRRGGRKAKAPTVLRQLLANGENWTIKGLALVSTYCQSSVLKIVQVMVRNGELVVTTAPRKKGQQGGLTLMYKLPDAPEAPAELGVDARILQILADVGDPCNMEHIRERLGDDVTYTLLEMRLNELAQQGWVKRASRGLWVHKKWKIPAIQG